LNPRPEIFHTGIYILSSDFGIRLFKSPPNSIFERLSCMVLAVSDAGGQKQHPCKVDALIGFAEKIRQNGSRLSGYGVCIIVCDYVYFPPFYEKVRSRYATVASLSPSKPFRPHI